MRALISSVRSSRQLLWTRSHYAAAFSVRRLSSSDRGALRAPPSCTWQASRRYHAQIQSLEEPTIYALSTASGRAAIAVIRISGPACKQVHPPCIFSECMLMNAVDIPRAVPIDHLPKTPSRNPPQALQSPSPTVSCDATRLWRSHLILSFAEDRDG
jgi:hypothetical protein